MTKFIVAYLRDYYPTPEAAIEAAVGSQPAERFELPGGVMLFKPHRPPGDAHPIWDEGLRLYVTREADGTWGVWWALERGAYLERGRADWFAQEMANSTGRAVQVFVDGGSAAVH